MTRRRLVALGLLLVPCLAPAAGIAGCSLVNSFGDVAPLESGGDSGLTDAGGGADRTLPPNPDSGVDTGTGADSPVGNEAAADTGPIADGGGPDANETGTLSAAGVLVVGGITSTDGGFTLTTLDPTTGAELNPSLRETMTVVSVHYDGLRDRWYIFENTGIGALFPAPTDPVFLHTRVLDPHTGIWTELSKLQVPAIVSTDTVAILNDRVAYTAYALNDAGTFAGNYELVLVDTSVPTAPALINPPLALQAEPTGTIGTRNPSTVSPGGTINLFHVDLTECQGDAAAELCELDVVHVTVQGAAAQAGAATPIAAVNPQGAEGVGSFLGGGPDDVIAFPTVNGKTAQVQRFSASTSAPAAGSTVSFGSGDVHLQELAISECYTMAFVVGVPNDTFLYGVPLLNVTTPVVSQDMGHAGQAVEYEPFTNTVIAPFRANGSFAIDAYSITGTAAAPVLAKRTGNWNPPADLEPNFVAARQPTQFACPTP
jgi:hypothetical protein